jgi:hypothetical protein
VKISDSEEKRHVQASDHADVTVNGAVIPQVSHCCEVGGPTLVAVEMLRRVPPLVSVEAGNILQLFVRLSEVHD